MKRENLMRPTISDIARRAGVSKTTVSRVLNNRPDVDEETRARVKNVIAELHYTPSVTAKSLSTGTKHLIGLLVPSMSSYFSLDVVRGVADGIADSQFELVLYTTGLTGNNREIYERALKSDLVDGLIVLLPRDENEHFLQKRQDFPIVAIDHKGIGSHLPSVTVTNRKGACEVTKYLIGLGHKKIGFITGLMDLGCSRDRLDGFRAAMDEAKLPIDENWIGYGDFTRVSAYLIAMNWLQRKNFLTAIVASNDEMAFGVMEVAEKLGINIPKQLSLVGFDDILEAKFRNPPLTTVRQPLFDLGREAAGALLKLIGGQSISSIQLETDLVIRNSCQPPSMS